MDEKTEELRDIFMSVTDDEAVTESQAETRGSLTDERAGDLSAVVEALVERYECSTDLDVEDRCAVVRAFYDGADDTAIADAVGVDPETATRARLDLHLYTDDDLDPDFDAEAVQGRLHDADPGTLAEALDADPDEVERYAAAVAARDRSLRANHRFRDRFDEILADSDLSRQLTRGVNEDGLEEATEDMETDVSF